MTQDLNNENEQNRIEIEIWTIQKVVQSAAEWLRAKSSDVLSNPRLDAEMLLASALDMDRMQLFLQLDRPLSKPERERFKILLAQRGNGMPVAQIVGHRDFYRHRFTVSAATLIPRPETETLVETSVEFLRTLKVPRVLDIGTGTGCIAISVAAEIPDATVEAWDISDEALDVARRNAEDLGTKNVSFLNIDALVADVYCDRKFNAIISNPPYIPNHEHALCSPETLKFEPRRALFAPDDDGLTFYRRFSECAGDILEEGGRIFLEFGFSQAEKVAQLFEAKKWRKIIVIKDLSGRDRVMSAEKP
jgi:release factor glutamine methyltransferase